MRRPTLAVVLAVFLAGCVSTGRPLAMQAAGPAFDPVVFFDGHTEGRGVLKIALHAPVTTLVEGEGRAASGGGVSLTQRVQRQDHPTSSRSWLIRPLGGGRYGGTLTDAVGPVTGDVSGNRLHLAFRMRGGLHAEQWLYLRPGRQVADNVMVVRKLGLPVARLDETITRVPDR